MCVRLCIKKGERVLKNRSKSNNHTVEYKSSGIMLNMAMDEYSKERERANALDNKAGFFMTVIVAIATIFIPIIPFAKLVKFFQATDVYTQKCISSICLTGIAAAFILLLIAFHKLYDAYKLTDYKRPSLDCIDNFENHTITNDQLNRGLCDHYKTVVDYNVEVNNKKCNSISAGIKLCGIGIMILVVTAIGLIITIGG